MSVNERLKSSVIRSIVAKLIRVALVKRLIRTGLSIRGSTEECSLIKLLEISSNDPETELKLSLFLMVLRLFVFVFTSRKVSPVDS
jgi:hypothetical protein